jgi:hypothetical protein
MDYVSVTILLPIERVTLSHKNQTFSVGIDYLHITRNYFVYLLNDLASNKTDEKMSTCIHRCPVNMSSYIYVEHVARLATATA